MKTILYIPGGQFDDFIECEGGPKCDSCVLRFKCYTSNQLYVANLSGKEVNTFVASSRMKNEGA